MRLPFTKMHGLGNDFVVIDARSRPLALTDDQSPWAGAVQAVCATLPPLRGEEREAVRRLAAEGPPAEEVGLDAYGGPAFDPALQPAGAPVDLPMPSLEGRR